MENQYFRLLEVKLKPRDTTQFHIHTLPSIFTQFTDNIVSSQVKGQSWVNDHNVEGNVYYKPYGKDSTIHRVTNCDKVPFHVTDMELLAPYESKFPFHSMPFPVLLDNERIVAYQLNASSLDEKVNSTHGPMLVELIRGNEVTYLDIVTKKSIPLKAGKYLYIPPGNTFSFSVKGGGDINMVLIEIK